MIDDKNMLLLSDLRGALTDSQRRFLEYLYVEGWGVDKALFVRPVIGHFMVRFLT